MRGLTLAGCPVYARGPEAVLVVSSRERSNPNGSPCVRERSPDGSTLPPTRPRPRRCQSLPSCTQRPVFFPRTDGHWQVVWSTSTDGVCVCVCADARRRDDTGKSARHVRTTWSSSERCPTWPRDRCRLPSQSTSVALLRTLTTWFHRRLCGRSRQ